jgi:hypothetical protein
MKTLLAIMQLIPALILVIKAIEEAIPGQGAGEQKLKMVREVMEVTDSSVTEIWPSLEKVIAVIVKTLKATGVFK